MDQIANIPASIPEYVEPGADPSMAKADQRTIAARRLRLGLTQKRLGDLAGFDQPTVSRAEQGRAIPEVLARLVETLTALERQREDVDRAEADRFWQAVGDAPHRARLLERIETVVDVLLDGTLADVELAQRLVDCLPEPSRRRLVGKG